MSSRQGIGAFIGRLFGRGAERTPAEQWRSRRGDASPEEVVQEYFKAVAAHDLDWMLATMTTERARLYADPRTVDKRRKTILQADVHGMVRTAREIPLPPLSGRYKERLVLEVALDLSLVEPDQRRDPSLVNGEQATYFVMVRERQGKPWMIADWGR